MEIHNLGDTYKMLDLPTEEEQRRIMATIPDSMLESFENDVITKSLKTTGVTRVSSHAIRAYITGYLHGASTQKQSTHVFLIIYAIIRKLFERELAREQEAVQQAGASIGLTE